MSTQADQNLARVLLAAMSAEVQSLQDEADVASVEIKTAAEYHRGRASAFAQTRRIVRRFDIAVRRYGDAAIGPMKYHTSQKLAKRRRPR